MNPSAGGWLLCFAFPIAGLGVTAASLYYVIRRDWRRTMPALSFYVAFSCITTLLLLALFYPGYFAHGALRDKLCSLYADGYQLFNAAEAILLVVVVYDLFALITRGRNAIRRVVQIILCAAFLGLAICGYILIPQRGSSVQFALARTTAIATRAADLTVIASMLLFFILKKLLGVRLNRPVGYFALLLGLYFPVDMILAFANKHPSQAGLFSILSQVWWLAFAGVLLTMLIKATPSSNLVTSEGLRSGG